LDSQDNVYITGRTTFGVWPQNYNFLTVKYNSNGELLWVVQYDSAMYDEASDIKLDCSENVYVTGHGSGDYITLKYDNHGNQLWEAHYNSPGNGDDRAKSLTLDTFNNVYVTGYCTVNSIPRLTTIKYDQNGAIQWIATSPGDSASYNSYTPCKIVLDSENNVIIAGMLNYDFRTIKYNPDGQQLWMAIYDGPNHQYDEPNALGIDSSGNVYVAGESTNNTSWPYFDDFLTIKYSTDGSVQWVQRYDGPGNSTERAKALYVNTEGTVYVTGYGLYYNPTYSNDYITIKYSTMGEQLWLNPYNGWYSTLGTPPSTYDEASGIAGDDERNIYVTGMSESGLSEGDYTTIKYGSDGMQLWAVRYDGAGYDYARAIAVDSDGSVIVTGESDTDPNNYGYDYLTIKYSQSPISITLTPLSPPIIIPANGGSFDFNASVVHNGQVQTPFSVWARIKYPDGSYTDPTLGPITINPPVGQTLTRLRTQSIPGVWPAGEYSYIGYANTTYTYPAIDSSAFSFTKSTTRDGGATVWEASCTGAPFPGEAENPFITHNSALITSLSPNPFNASTTIRFDLPQAGMVRLEVFDVSGRSVGSAQGRPLREGWLEAGSYEAAFDGSNLPSGVYLARLTAGEFTAVQKMVLLK
jgi:uncharacterized delta-60 repeat protein